MRKIISIVIGIALIALAVFIANSFVANKKKPKPVAKKVVKTVFIQTAKNSEIPVTIKAGGNLVAKERISIFSEVQGVFSANNHRFKAGNSFNRGTVMIRINSEEFYANLQAQRNAFFNTVLSILPDIQLDFPNEYQKWLHYTNGLNVNKTTPELPKTNSEKENYFISGKGLKSSFYAVKNLEVKLAKYNIRAPFSGVLTEALVTPGSLVRQGQKLGDFINPKVFELEVAINAKDLERIKVGETVQLFATNKTQKYTGKVARINGSIDSNTQTVKAFVQVSNSELKEGQYLEASIVAKKQANAIQLSRNLLVDTDKVYVVQDNTLKLIKVVPMYFTDESVIVQGIKDGELLLAKPVSGAFDGMKVSIFTAQ